MTTVPLVTLDELETCIRSWEGTSIIIGLDGLPGVGKTKVVGCRLARRLSADLVSVDNYVDGKKEVISMLSALLTSAVQYRVLGAARLLWKVSV